MSPTLKLNRRTWTAALCAGLLAAINIGAAAQTPYRFTPLDGPGGAAYSIGYGLNGHGAVVGSSQGNARRATLWRRNRPLDLGQPTEESIAYGVNRHLAVVGESRDAVRGDWQATLWQGGAATVLPSLGGGYSVAYSINNAGQVVGGSALPGDLQQLAVRWDGGAPVTLGTPPGWSSGAYAINARGDAVGWAHGPWSASLKAVGGADGAAEAVNHRRELGGAGSCGSNTSRPPQAMLWAADGSYVVLGTSAQAVAVNRHRWAVGCGGDPYFPRARLWRDGAEIVLGMAGYASFAMGIDDEGTVVGYSYKIPNSERRATLWRHSADPATVVVDLNTWLDDSTRAAGWVLLEAQAINADGVITGLAKNSITGLQRAYRLTPP